MLTPCRLFALTRREFAALVAIFALSLPAVTARIYSSDEVEYFSYLRSLWFDRDLSFENEYQYFFDRDVARAEGFHETFLENQTEAGRRPNFGTIGCALLWSPFYAVGDLTARTLRNAGYDVTVDGYSRPYLAAVAYGSAVYGFLAVLLSIGAARRVLLNVPVAASFNAATDHAVVEGDERRGPGASLKSALLIWVGTPLLFYMYVAPPMSHACSAFAVAVFVTVWLHVRRTWTTGQVILLGLSGALMAMVREQDVFFLLGPALDFAISQVPRERWRAIGKGGPGYSGVRDRFSPTARGVHAIERTSHAVAARHAKDDVDRAARAGGALLSGSRLLHMDASRSPRDRRPGGPGDSASAGSPPPRDPGAR